MSADLKTVKIPAAAYEAIRAAREELLRRGIDALPQELVAPAACPVCGARIGRSREGARYLHCLRCNYRQQWLTGTSDNGVALGIGVLIGLGAAALLNAMAAPGERTRTRTGRTSGRTTRGLQLRKRAFRESTR